MKLRIIDKIIFHFNHRFFVKQWIIGFAKDDIKGIIRKKRFDKEIKWLHLGQLNRQYADPFFLKQGDNTYDLFIEDVTTDDHYGKLALLTVDQEFNQVDHTIILDTHSHLSYPYIYRENGKIYVFPEASRSRKLSCYEYNPSNKSLSFLKEIIDLPLLDSNIFRYQGKYWSLGAVREKSNQDNYEMFCFISDNLLGPYAPHPANPIKKGLDGIRAAGNIIEVDGVLYRPTQDCGDDYGKSITINRINVLSEEVIDEQPYMSISINRKEKSNAGMRNIHTINVIDDLIVVDGKKWTFSPIRQHRELMKEKKYLKKV